mmetsp:Transcript_10555/g.64860  ORF Transcript_10555/g.64860 Transcript_10555/m.64860 type:complete len:317 (+) Transcript_10555:2756-3706(+)
MVQAACPCIHAWFHPPSTACPCLDGGLALPRPSHHFHRHPRVHHVQTLPISSRQAPLRRLGDACDDANDVSMDHRAQEEEHEHVQVEGGALRRRQKRCRHLGPSASASQEDPERRIRRHGGGAGRKPRRMHVLDVGAVACVVDGRCQARSRVSGAWKEALLRRCTRIRVLVSHGLACRSHVVRHGGRSRAQARSWTFGCSCEEEQETTRTCGWFWTTRHRRRSERERGHGVRAAWIPMECDGRTRTSCPCAAGQEHRTARVAETSDPAGCAGTHGSYGTALLHHGICGGNTPLEEAQQCRLCDPERCVVHAQRGGT